MIRRYITDLIAIVTITGGIIAIGGWFSEFENIKPIFSGLASTQFNTTFCLILAGFALYAANNAKRHRLLKRVSVIAASLVIIISGLGLVEDLTGLHLAPDQLFFSRSAASNDPGRIEIFSFILFLALGLTLTQVRKGGSQLFVQVMVPLLFFVSVFITFNYISGLGYLETMPIAVNMALISSLGIMLLCIGIFFSRPLANIQFSFEKKVAAYVAVTILLLGIVFFSFSANNANLIRTNQMVEGTQNVLLKTAEILSQAQDIETGTRGFLITKNDEFLEPFERGSARILRTINELKQMRVSEPQQRALIDSVVDLTLENISFRQGLIDMKRAGLENPLMVVMTAGAEKQLMDKLRNVIVRIQEIEQSRLQQRIVQSEKAVRGSQRIITAIELIVLALLIAVCIVIFRNTKSRNAAEAALRRSEQFARGVIDNAASVITIKDLNGRYLLVNGEAQRLLGASENEIIGKSVFDFYPKEMGDEAIRLDTEVATNGTRTETPTELMTGTGRRHLITVRFPLFDENRKTYAVCSMSNDITSIREAQRLVEEANKQQQDVLNGLEQLMEASLDIICLIKEDGEFLQVGSNCKQVLGYDAGEMVGHHYTEFMLPEDQAFSLSKMVDIRSGAMMKDCENRYYKKDGSVVPILWTVIWSPQSNMFFAIIRDATEKKMTAQQLTELNENLQKRAAELLKSNMDLERFAYVASHDLQEPLRMVSSFLQLLQKRLEGTLDDTGRQYIAFAVDGAERMKTLIRDLLQYSRIGTSKETIVEINCNEILQAVLNVYQLTIAETDARVTVHPLPVIRGEKSHIYLLFQNLVGNAIKYSLPKKPIIEVGCIEKPDSWQFYVKDEGIGISKQFYEKIFVIFQRLHHKSEYSGTGIGLAICKKIVERHGGTIWLESEQHVGTTFFVSLPR